MFKTLNAILILSFIFTLGCQSNDKSNFQVKKEDDLNIQSIEMGQKLVNTHWKLIELYGKPITQHINNPQDVHLILNPSNNSISGFAGCNQFFGDYELKAGMRINISLSGSTLKACHDAAFDEHTFLSVLELTDNYIIYKEQLQLNVGRRAPLAVFKAMVAD